jgi:azurin
MPPAYLTINAMPAEMSYQQKELRAFAGQPLRLVFNNLHPDLHNVVLLKADTDVEAFGETLGAYLTDPNAVNTKYIPPAQQEKVIAATEVLTFRDTASLDVEGLPPGTYVYLCTVPGHWQLMQGVLTIEPAR